MSARLRMMRPFVRAIWVFYQRLFLSAIVVTGAITFTLILAGSVTIVVNFSPLFSVSIASLITAATSFAIRRDMKREFVEDAIQRSQQANRTSAPQSGKSASAVGGRNQDGIRNSSGADQPQKLKWRVAMIAVVIVIGLLLGSAVWIVDVIDVRRKPTPSNNKNNSSKKMVVNHNDNRSRKTTTEK